ncbi:hypothetical protein Q8F55_000344 [Vanrija albida]|uniref:NmrA-like domain-containing protein n=1 Tax=Vanrija albida TaxID=181172 RepID=A0ABR3QDL1_9TREE
MDLHAGSFMGMTLPEDFVAKAGKPATKSAGKPASPTSPSSPVRKSSTPPIAIPGRPRMARATSAGGAQRSQLGTSVASNTSSASTVSTDSSPMAAPKPLRARGSTLSHTPHHRPHVSLLSSSPTRTPFAVDDTLITPLALSPGGSSPLSAFGVSPGSTAFSHITRTGSNTAPVTRVATPSSPTARTSPKLNGGAGLARAPSPLSAAASPPKSPKSKGMSFLTHKMGKLLDFDGMLGPLDPNKMASMLARDPIPTVVFGAETEAGYAVVRALLNARCWAVVALVVDDTNDLCAKLRDEGVPVIQVDMDNPGSYAKHLKGAKAVYLSTNVIALHAILVHQPEPKRTEFARAADLCQLAKAVNACARAKVGHVVFRTNSCGHEVSLNTMSTCGIFHDAPEELLSAGVPTTTLHSSVPYNRIVTWLRNGTNGSLILDIPVPDDTKIPFFAIEQTGDYVLAALNNPKRWVGKDMYAQSELFTPTEIAAVLSKVSGRKVETAHVTRAQFDSLESHERLTCRWDAWAQLVRGEYHPEPYMFPTTADVPHQWSWQEWQGSNLELHQVLRGEIPVPHKDDPNRHDHGQETLARMA